MHARGGCDCGGVAYEVSGPLRDVWDCHCARCRRITGHHMAATAAAVDDLTVTAQESLVWYEAAVGVEYGFCSTCGSTLFWRNDSRPEVISVAAGSLQQPTGLVTSTALWCEEAGDYYTRPSGVRELARED